MIWIFNMKKIPKKKETLYIRYDTGHYDLRKVYGKESSDPLNEEPDDKPIDCGNSAPIIPLSLVIIILSGTFLLFMFGLTIVSAIKGKPVDNAIEHPQPMAVEIPYYKDEFTR
jgi:hypothetical protein